MSCFGLLFHSKITSLYLANAGVPLFSQSIIYQIVLKDKVNKSFLMANAFTYLMLEVLAISQLVKGYIEGRG